MRPTATIALLPLLAACQPDPQALDVRTEDGVDLPLAGISDADLDTFVVGDALFDATFAPGDGLGPVYIRASCGSCHAEGGRGPGTVQKMSIVQADGVTPSDDQSVLAWGPTVHPYTSGDATTPIEAPTAGWPDGDSLLVTLRYPPTVLGRGHIEAIEDEEIERVQAEQANRSDGIHGRINRVSYHSERNPDATFGDLELGATGLIGRFGLKARQPTLDDFAADALQGDMGITSPLRPSEVANPDDLADDHRAGLDTDADTVNLLATYMRLIAIPDRDPEAAVAGAPLFDEVGCAVCHVATLHTRADYPIAEIADLDAPVYTDLLLHDLGADMADGLTDESATSTEWKTAPLIGLRFMRNYLHDGRATTIEDAIEGHSGPGSEANDVIDVFDQLSDADQTALITFVQSL